MSGTLSFLFQGQAPQSTTQYGQSTTNVPTWLQQYNQGVLAQSMAMASQPYQPYGGPRIAGFTPDQMAAQTAVRNMQGGYLPTLNTASSMATKGASAPGINTGMGYLGNAYNRVGSAENMTNYNKAYGYLPMAQNTLNSALAPDAAQMNPYEQNVINKAETDASQYWKNTLQPSIQNQFTAAGQYGSSADELAQEQAANQLTENLQATANAQLAQGYAQAQSAGLAGAAQEAGLGQLQGNLAGTQTGLGLQGAQTAGQLGQITGGLGYEGGVLGLQGASQLGSLAQERQGLGLQGAGALSTSGLEQQNLNQQNLSLGYQDFLNQQAYPYQQTGWLQSALAGGANPNMIPYTSTNAGTGYAPTYSASPIAQSMGLYSMYGNRGGRANRRRIRMGYLPVRRAA